MRYKIPPANIKKWVEKNFDVKKTRRNGAELVIVNPLYDTNKPRFNINIETGGCHDWNGDEWAGPPNSATGKRPCNIIKFVQLVRNLSFREALHELVGPDALALVSYSSGAKEAKEEPKAGLQVQIPPGFKPLLDGNGIMKGPPWNYLLKRGYTPEEIIRDNIHFRASDILWLYTEFGELVYMQSRNIYNKTFWFPPTDVKDKDGKIIGKLDVTRDHVMYGFDDVPRSDYVIITESIFDKMTLGLHCLSSGGVILSDGQLNRINLIGPKKGVVLAPDNDMPAIESIIENGPRLAGMGYKVFFSIPPKIPYVNGKGEKVCTKDWNELLTGLKYTRSQAIATMNQRLVPFNETTRMKLRQMMVFSEKVNQNVQRKKFF